MPKLMPREKASIASPEISIPVVWQPGHMQAAKKKLSQVLKSTDIVLELRDARLPALTSPAWFEERLRQKSRLLACNKSALADPEVNQQWLEFWKQQQQPAILLDADSKQGLKQLFQAIQFLGKPSRQRFHRRNMQPPALRILIIGLPNVGKSTLINRLGNKKRTAVAPQPGVTRGITWINLPPNMLVMDTPGILPPRVENQQQLLWLAWSGCLPDHTLNLPHLTALLLTYLLDKPQPQLLQWLKPIIPPTQPNFSQTQQLLRELCQHRGWLLPKAQPHLHQAAQKFFSHFRTGKLGRYSFQRPKHKPKNENI